MPVLQFYNYMVFNIMHNIWFCKRHCPTAKSANEHYCDGVQQYIAVLSYKSIRGGDHVILKHVPKRYGITIAHRRVPHGAMGV